MKLGGPRLLVLLLCYLCSATSVASNSAAEVHPWLVEQLAGAELAEANEDFETARKLYLSIIEEIDRNHDGYDSALIGPLVGLGRTYQRLGDPLSAEEALQRAQHLIHRTEGVHALSQLEIVELMTDVNLGKGEPFDADTQQKFAMYISERNFEATSDLLPSLTRLTTWYTDTGQFYHANKTLERAMDLVTADGGEQDPRLIPLLIDSARIKRLSDSCCSYRPLESALEIMVRTPDLPADTWIRLYESLADAYMASHKQEQARAAYAKTWELLGTDIARERYESPTLIAMAEKLQRTSSAREYIYTPEAYRRGLIGQPTQAVTGREKLLMETLPPQQFWVPLDDGNRNFYINDVYSPNDVVEPAQRVVGQPFRFIKKQLEQVLPLKLRADDALADIYLEMEFTVKSDGGVTDIEFRDGNAPNRLVRLMREVLYQTTFRPRIVEGYPIATEHFRLKQTFKP